LQAGRLTKEYPDKTAKSASDFLKYVIDEIKKIDFCKNLTENSNYAIIEKMQIDVEVMEKKFAA
jgi:hypothetical protein